MPISRWSTILVLLAFAAPATAQVKLEWQLKEGESFFIERVYTQKQSVEIKGKAFKEQRTKTLLTAVTVKEKSASGYVLDLRIDSANFQALGTPSNLDDKIAARMKGSRFTATVTPRGKLVKLEGYDAFIQRLAEKDAAVEKILRSLLSEEAIREDLDEIFHLLPEKPVQVGEKWKRDATEPVPPFGALKSTFEYVLEGDQGDEVGIGCTIKMAYRPATGDGDLFRIVKGSLRAEEGKGRILFDVKNGRLVTSSRTVEIHGDVVIETMGRQTEMEFKSANTLRVRLFTD